VKTGRLVLIQYTTAVWQGGRPRN